MCPIAHVCPIAMCPIAPGSPSICGVLTTLTHVPHCPCAHCPCVKKMSSCQKDVKLSKRCLMSKSQTHRLWRRFIKKNKLTSILTSNMKVTKIVQKHFLYPFWGFLVTIICDVKIDVNMWTSLCQNIFFVNLFHSLCVWLFDIWHLFDNLTSFWHFDIFWQFFSLNHLSLSQGYFFVHYIEEISIHGVQWSKSQPVPLP